MKPSGANWRLIGLWLISRAAIYSLLWWGEKSGRDDPKYYLESFQGLDIHHITGTLIEYPVPGLLLLAVPWLLVDWIGHHAWFAGALGLMALAADGLFMWALHRSRRWSRNNHQWWGISTAEWAWLIAVPALGGISYARFDIFPGVLVGLAVLQAAHRPRFAAGLATVGASLKYWPALVLPALAAPRNTRRGVVTVIVLVGGALAGISIAISDFERQLTPITWQSDRGLQIESIGATVPMLMRLLNPEKYTVHKTVHNAYEVFGPGVDTFLLLTTVATGVLVVGLGALWLVAAFRLQHHDDPRARDAVTWLIITAVLGFMVTSKVFSPQYLLWVLPAAAAALAVILDGEAWRRMGVWCAILLAATAMTHGIFPWLYSELRHETWSAIPATLLLSLRNVLVVALFVQAVRESIRVLGRPSADSVA